MLLSAMCEGTRVIIKEEAARLYSENKITLAKAAEEAGVSLSEMMDYVRQRKIPAQYDLEQLEHDLKVVYQRVGKKV